MPACDLDRSVAFCFYNKREKPNTLVSVFSGEVQGSIPGSYFDAQALTDAFCQRRRTGGSAFVIKTERSSLWRHEG